MDMSTFTDIAYEKDTDTGLATLILNRPERRNALSFYSFFEIHQAVEDFENDAEMYAMIVTGGVDPHNPDPQREAFSSGGYFHPEAMKDVPEETLQQIDMTDIAQKKLVLRMFDCEKPIVSAINGLAIGGAFTLALAGSDLIFMSEHAWFQLPFIRLGIVAELGSSFLLPRLVGLQKAKELIYCAKKVPAAEAFELGLVNAVLSHNELMPYSREQALSLVPPVGPAIAIRRMKRIFHQPHRELLSQALDLENEGLNACIQTAEFLEGVRAMSEKREPRFDPPQTA